MGYGEVDMYERKIAACIAERKERVSGFEHLKSLFRCVCGSENGRSGRVTGFADTEEGRKNMRNGE